MEKDFGNGARRGRLLARGRGGYSMMDICYKRGYSDENTILVVDNVNDLDSTWRIYERR